MERHLWCGTLKYAQLLSDLIKKNKTKVWLVNTGWSGGAYGVGERFSLKYTRAIIDAILGNELNDVRYDTDVFGLSFPTSCKGVPSEVLNPVNTWSDKSSFANTAKKLADLFEKNFASYADQASQEVIAAAPKS